MSKKIECPSAECSVVWRIEPKLFMSGNETQFLNIVLPDGRSFDLIFLKAAFTAEESEAIAARIVAAVNFCNGMSLEELQSTRQNYKRSLEQLQDQLAEWKQICQNRDVTVNQQGEEWAKLKTEIDTLKDQLADITKNRDECAGVFKIDREHQVTGPIKDCACPSCILHHRYQYLLSAHKKLVDISNRLVRAWDGKANDPNLDSEIEYCEEMLTTILAEINKTTLHG